MASDAAVRQAAAQIPTATGRIHHLVSAVKGFTFMDREGVPENVDVARGLSDTVAMLESKSSAKSVQVRAGTSRRDEFWANWQLSPVDAPPVGARVTTPALASSIPARFSSHKDCLGGAR